MRSQRQRRVKGRNRRVHPRKIPAKANQSRCSPSLPLFDSRIYNAIFWHRCESFYIFRMHVLGYPARVPRDEGECEGGLARNDSGAQWDRRTGILRMEFGLAVSRCIQIVFLLFLPKDNFRYSIFIPRSDGEAELGKITGLTLRPSSRKRHILPLRISGKL